jgi:phosphoglycolate phosphatase
VTARRSGGQPPTPRGVVFALDGTLVDGYLGITTGVNAARAAFALPAMTVDDVRGRVGHGLPHLMADVVGPDRAVAGAEIFRAAYDRVCEDQTRPVPELSETLSGLAARGVRMSVASNKPAAYSVRILDRLAVRSYFDAIEGPETAGAAKPDPAMILACLSAMRVLGPEALYVGDMTIDAEAGTRAGVAVVLVAGGSCPAGELAATGRPVLASLGELLRFFT